MASLEVEVLMALNSYVLEAMVNDLSSRGEMPHGRILTLSRYAINCRVQFFNEICVKYGWDNRLDYDGLFVNDRQFFPALGFEQLESMDYSDFEGADLVWDLNNPNIPDEYCGRYDYVLDCGTLEHVFHQPNAFEVVYKVLKAGGTFYFDQPVFFGINHGFYNFSTFLHYEYFTANKWKLNCFRLLMEKSVNGIFEELSVSEETLRKGAIPIKEGVHCVLFGSVTKTDDTICKAVPQQPSYAEAWQGSREGSRLSGVFDEMSDGAVFIYGTGLAAISFIEKLLPERRAVLETRGGALSAVSDEIGKYLIYGIKIHDISVVKPGDVVIIASLHYQDIIYDRIKHLEQEGILIMKL
jgi:hypothetical protein